MLSKIPEKSQMSSYHMFFLKKTDKKKIILILHCLCLQIIYIKLMITLMLLI